MRLNIEEAEGRRRAPTPKMRQCVPRCIVVFGLTMTALLGTFIGFSIYTIPYGHVGYVNGSTDPIQPGLYFQVPWLPKPYILDVNGAGVIVLDHVNASSVLRKLCQLKYTVEDVKAYIDRITTQEREKKDFKLPIELEEAIDVTTKPSPDVFNNSTLPFTTLVV